MISPKGFFKSLSHALRGLRLIFNSENSFRIQSLVAVAVLLVAFTVPLEDWERILLILLIAAVLVLEILNTIFERISDILKPRLHPLVAEIKDMMAGAVLLTSITAASVATLIFWTYFTSL